MLSRSGLIHLAKARWDKHDQCHLVEMKEAHQQFICHLINGNSTSDDLDGVLRPYKRIIISCTTPHRSPIKLGKYMLKSFITTTPPIDQSKQFNTLAKVNGKGMFLADLVKITSRRTARGLANRVIQKKTPAFPMIAAAVPLFCITDNNRVNTIMKVVP